MTLLSLVSDRRGTVAMEMAVTIPILLALFVAGVDLTRFMLLQQDVVYAANTATNLAGRDAVPELDEREDILAAISHLLDPGTAGPGSRAAITGVMYDPDQQEAVISFQNLGAGTLELIPRVGLGEGAPATLPADLEVAPGELILVAEVAVVYQPLFAGTLLGEVVIGHQSIMKPRSFNVLGIDQL